MPNVPQVAGVPALSGYGLGAGALLVADAADLASLVLSAISPKWGIFLNGIAVIQPASVATNALSSVGNVASLVAPGGPGTLSVFGISLPTTASFISFDYKQDWTVATYPVEDGGFQSYDKVQLPFDVRVRLASSGSAVQIGQFLNAIDTMANDLNRYDIVTPSNTYSSCNVVHYDYRRTAESGVSMVVVDLWFQQIRVTSTAMFTTTQSPTDAGQQGLGNVSPQIPSNTLSGVPSQVT